jgi:hypothetical protein
MIRSRKRRAAGTDRRVSNGPSLTSSVPLAEFASCNAALSVSRFERPHGRSREAMAELR